MNTKNEYVPPVPEPVREKGDDLDWANLPQEPSDLNFRPPVPLTNVDCRQVLGLLLLVGCFAIPFSMFFRVLLGQHFVAPVPFALAFLVACALGLMQAIKACNAKAGIREIWLWFAFPMQIWGMIAMAPQTHSFAWAGAYFGLLALPSLFILVDEFATHAVHWFTASPAASLARMQISRKTWAQRFDFPSSVASKPEIGTTSEDTETHSQSIDVPFHDGLKAVALAFLVAFIPVILLAACGAQGYRLGFWLFVSSCLALAIFGVFAQARNKANLGLWWRAFFGWFVLGRNQRYPGWVFQTPSGSPLRRQILLIQTCWFVALSWVYLTDHFSWFLTCDPVFVDLLVGQSQHSDKSGLGPDYFLRGGALAIFYFLVAIMACAVAPAVFMLQVIFVATGPLVRRLSDLFEEPHE